MFNFILQSAFQNVIEVLENTGVESGTQTVTDFATRNNASISITDVSGQNLLLINTSSEDNDMNETNKLNTYTEFRYGDDTYTMNATTSLTAVSQSYHILIQLIPFITVTIILISIVGACICSRYFSKPLVDICDVARRMRDLDMTWKCDTGREDEIGILAVSLNEMSEKLKDALDSLQDANLKLQKDIENERRQEQQRIDFFTSISHELKTPITVIKGELEGMVYQVGEYKDRNTHLRQSLKTVEEMEHLLKEMLTAARMEGNYFQMIPVDIDISEMVRTCCHKMQGIIEDKNMQLIL